MNTKNNKKFQETQHKMNRVLIQMLEKKKYDAICISEICKQAGVTRATFYGHYKDTSQMLMDAERDLSVELQDTILTLEHSSFTPSFIALFEYVKKHQYFYQIYLHMNNQFPLFEMILHHVDPSRMERLSKYLGIESSKERAYHSTFFQNGMVAVLKLWLEGGCAETPEKMAEIIRIQYHLVEKYQ